MYRTSKWFIFHKNLPTKLKFPCQNIDHLLSSNLRRYIVVGTEIEFHIYRENVKISENFTVFTSWRKYRRRNIDLYPTPPLSLSFALVQCTCMSSSVVERIRIRKDPYNFPGTWVSRIRIHKLPYSNKHNKINWKGNFNKVPYIFSLVWTYWQGKSSKDV